VVNLQDPWRLSTQEQREGALLLREGNSRVIQHQGPPGEVGRKTRCRHHLRFRLPQDEGSRSRGRGSQVRGLSPRTQGNQDPLSVTRLK